MSDEVDNYRSFIGRTQTALQFIDPEIIRIFSAVADDSYDPYAKTVPPMSHWAFFHSLDASKNAGLDGHPIRGSFIPAISLPLRMFAAEAIEFLAPLRTGNEAHQTMTIADIRHQYGKSGELVFVDVKIEVVQFGTICILEKRTYVFRQSGKTKPISVITKAQPLPAPGADRLDFTPSAVDLFRFSTVTFNSHRIHYDRDYARHAEGYPDLVVHGPYIAVRLCSFARKRNRLGLKRFTFRATSPSFVDQKINFIAIDEDSDWNLCAYRLDGNVSMIASAQF
jgi:3-methylfumaryl-CoA hydratase